MSPISTGFIGIGAVLLLMACGMPIAFAMMLVGFAGFSYLVNVNAAFHVVGTISFNIAYKYDYTVLPLFLLMAAICLSTGLGRSLFRLVYAWMGRLSGGLSMATIGACALFAAASASSIATAVTMGLVALPEMKEYKYDSGLATGCIAAGGTLGILIPPSGILIVYGIITEQSIGELFVAGIIPGIILALMFMAMINIRARLNPKLAPPGPSISFKEKLVLTGDCAEMLVLLFLVIGGLIIGWFTPTEAGAIGALGAIVLSLIRRRLTRQGFKDAVIETLRDTGMIFAIIIGAFIFNPFLAVTTIPMELAGMIEGLGLHPILIMILIIFTYMILGCFIDAFAMILLTMPIFFPLATGLGFNPIWFGIVVVLVVEMGMITPPVGMNVYVVSGIARDVPMDVIFKGIAPFVVVEAVFVAILIAFPQIALFLPRLMY